MFDIWFHILCVHCSSIPSPNRSNDSYAIIWIQWTDHSASSWYTMGVSHADNTASKYKKVRQMQWKLKLQILKDISHLLQYYNIYLTHWGRHYLYFIQLALNITLKQMCVGLEVKDTFTFIMLWLILKNLNTILVRHFLWTPCNNIFIIT